MEEEELELEEEIQDPDTFCTKADLHHYHQRLSQVLQKMSIGDIERWYVSDNTLYITLPYIKVDENGALNLGDGFDISEIPSLPTEAVLDVDQLYPIGSEYTSYSAESPAETLGGTWVQKEGYDLEGRYKWERVADDYFDEPVEEEEEEEEEPSLTPSVIFDDEE